jgi:hypothetical protein
MKPKEKATELVEKFWKVTQNLNLVDYGKGRAIECVIISVEEIINLDVIWFDKDAHDHNGKTCDACQTFEFWEKVLNELKSMQ